MFLELDFAEMQQPAVRGEVNEKKVNFFAILTVTAETVTEAVQKYEHAKNVVLFKFVGTLEELQYLLDNGLVSSKLAVFVQLKDAGHEAHFVLNSIPSGVRIIGELPADFSDLRSLEALSLKFPQVRYVGGKLLRMPSIPVGLLALEELPRKIPVNRVAISTNGKDGVFSIVDRELVDNLEFFTPTVKSSGGGRTAGTRKEKAPSVAKPKKKKLSSLASLHSVSGFDNF